MRNTRFKKSMAALAVAATLGVAVPAYANTTSNIVGTINAVNKDNITISVKNPTTGYSRNISLNETGNFRFSKLPTGVYEVTVMEGDKVVGKESVTVRLGSNAAANFDLDAGVTERISVTGARISAVDVSTTDSGLVIGELEFDRMPVPRNLTAVALLAPGTVPGDSQFSSPNSGGTASFGGASVAENSCYINGMEVTNTSQGLGCGSVPFEFYKEFQVKTGGYSAQFGRTTGGVINAVTKSGTNEWEFGATVNYIPKSLREDGRKSKGNGGTSQVFRDQTNDEYGALEYTVSAAGPIIEDKLFIYALVNPRDVSNNFASQSSARQQYAPDDIFVKRESSGGDNLFWGTKLDWLINDDHTLSLFAYSNKSDTESTSYRYDAEKSVIGKRLDTTVRKRGGELKSINYTGVFTDDLTVSAMYGEIETDYTNIPNNQTCPSVSDSRQIPDSQKIQGCAGNSTTVGVNTDKNKQTRVDIEYALDDHLIRVGYDKQVRDTNHTTAPIAGHAWTYSSLAPNATIQGNNGALYTNNTGQAIDYVSDRIFSGGGGFTTDLNAWYIEDEWQVTDDLKLNLGLRRDEFENAGVTGKVFSSFKTDVAPRLGFSWDPTGDGDSKFYGTWGRYYLPVPNNTNYLAASGISDSTTYYTFTGSDATGSPTGISPIAGGNSTVVNSVPNPAIQATFQSEEAEPFSKDELILGYETVLTDALSVSVRGTLREVNTALDDYCGPLASQASCTLLNPGKSATWQVDNNNDAIPDPGSRRTYTAAEIGLPEAENKYTAIQTQLNYNQDDLRMTFIYTWSRSTGNFEGAVKSDIGQADPGITQDFDFPALMDGASGYQANDRRHVFKLFGSYNITEDFSVGFNSTLSSGRPLSAFGQGYPDHSSNVYGSYGDTFYHFTGRCGAALQADGSCAQSDKIYNYVPRGSVGRTPWVFNVDLSANYEFTFNNVDMKATVNVYNVLNNQEITSQNEHYEARRSEGTLNQYYGAAYTWQTPRYIELGLEARF